MLVISLYNLFMGLYFYLFLKKSIYGDEGLGSTAGWRGLIQNTLLKSYTSHNIK